jgi:hypothetical protein
MIAEIITAAIGGCEHPDCDGHSSGPTGARFLDAPTQSSQILIIAGNTGFSNSRTPDDGCVTVSVLPSATWLATRYRARGCIFRLMKDESERASGCARLL